MKQSKILLAHIALFLVMLIYGANFTVSKEIIPLYMSPLGLVMLRLSFGTLVFWLLHSFFYKSSEVERKDFRLLFLCGLFGASLNQITFFIGLAQTKPINAAIIMLIVPIIVTLGAVFYHKEKIRPINTFGIALGCIGALIVILLGSSQSSVTTSGQIGDLLVLLNATLFATYLLIVQPLVKKYNNIVILKWVFTIGLMISTPFCLPELLKTNWQIIPNYVYWCIAYVMLFVTVFTYLFYAFGLQNLPSSVVGVYVYLQPVLAAIIAIGLGKDELNVVKICGAVLIFSGVFLASRRKMNR